MFQEFSLFDRNHYLEIQAFHKPFFYRLLFLSDYLSDGTVQEITQHVSTQMRANSQMRASRHGLTFGWPLIENSKCFAEFDWDIRKSAFEDIYALYTIKRLQKGSLSSQAFIKMRYDVDLILPLPLSKTKLSFSPQHELWWITLGHTSPLTAFEACL